MTYAQINYQETVGNSNLTIREIGCFVTADCNLLEDIGQEVAPDALNAFYRDHGIYTYDLTDRANDDITWGTITNFNPNVVVAEINNSGGWPQSNFAIVKFVYRSHTGYMTTHFCKVADWQKHLIVDSYDGQVKSPGTYYGDPVAYATFVNNTPAPAPAANAEPNYDGNAITIQHGWGLSNAAEAAGYPDAISAARWQAIAELNGSDDWQAFNSHLLAGQRIIVGAYVPPAAAPSAAPDNVPSEPAKPANIEFTRFATPLNLVVTHDPTHVWALDFDVDHDAVSVQDLPKDTPFVAVGKGQRTDHDRPVYYMDADSFGNADTTGIPTKNQGINVADLLAASAPVASVTPAAPDEGEKVEVHVVSPDPNKWKLTYKAFLGPVEFKATSNDLIKDLDGQNPDQQLVDGAQVMVAGQFEKDGVKYYRTVKSVENNVWYGVPQDVVVARNGKPELADDIDTIVKEAATEAGKIMDIKQRSLKFGGTMDGFFSRLLRALFHRKK